MLRVYCLLLGLVAAVQGACPAPFVEVGEGCYYFSYKDDLKMNWMEARTHCQSLASRADLAVLNYMCFDYNHVANYIIMEDIHTTMEPMYIGADGYDASWFWVDDRALSPNSIYWFEKQPTVEPGCVFLLPAKPHNYKKVFLSKGVCTATRYFICQNEVHAF
nr:C type lectin [Scylla paramamosain]